MPIGAPSDLVGGIIRGRRSVRPRAAGGHRLESSLAGAVGPWRWHHALADRDDGVTPDMADDSDDTADPPGSGHHRIT